MLWKTRKTTRSRLPSPVPHKTDGGHAASIVLLGNYTAGSFVATADGHGGTLGTVTHAVP
jgi:hypothetical protein